MREGFAPALDRGPADHPRSKREQLEIYLKARADLLGEVKKNHAKTLVDLPFSAQMAIRQIDERIEELTAQIENLEN